jgi:hypothetical protein
MSAISVGAEAEHVAHDVVGLGDQLHVAVLDAVVHHLDEVPAPPGPDVGDAGAVVHLCGDRFPDRADRLVRDAVAAGHQARAPQRALLATGNARADEAEPFGLQRLLAPLGVGEVRIAAVDDDIACCRYGLICAIVQSTDRRP